MTDRIIKLKGGEFALTVNNTVSNSLTTISSGALVRLFNSNTTTPFQASVYAANVANIQQGILYANVTIAPLQDIFVYKVPTDMVNGNAQILAVSVAFEG
jgi:hypothetical protein